MKFYKYLPLLTFLSVFKIQAQPINSKFSIIELKQQLLTSTTDTGKINILNTLASQYKNIQPDSGLYYGKQAIQLALKANMPVTLGEAYNCTGDNFRALSDSANAMNYYRQAYKIYSSSGNKDGMAWSIHKAGNVCFFISADYLQALNYYHKSLGLFKQVNEKQGIATSSENLAIVYESLGNYVRAQQLFQQAEEIDIQLHDEQELATHYSHMGIFYDDMNQYQKALDYSKKSLNIFQKTGHKAGITHNLGAIGSIYISLKKYNNAIAYFRQSIKISKEMNDQLSIAQSTGNMGLAFFALNKYDQALQCYHQSYTINEMLGNKADMAGLLNNIGDVYANQQRFNYSKALSSYNQSLQMAKEISDVDVQQYALQNLSNVYAKQKDYYHAYTNYKAYIIVRDSILNDEKRQEIQRKEIAFTYNQKEQLLKAQQDKKNALAAAEIKKQKLVKNYTLAGVAIALVFAAFIIISFSRRRKIKFEKQVKEVEMKALRAQMNPHFIFNSLQSINKFVLENDKEKASAYLSKFASLMRMILENSRAQEVPLSEDVKALETYIQLEALRFKNTFTYSIKTDELLDKENTLIPPMLLQPFVENAILHGVQNKVNGEIKIDIRKVDNGTICCTIEDNGKLNENNIAVNEEGGKHKSLATIITGERLNIINQVKKVKASVNIFSTKNADTKTGGRRVELMLPLQLAF